MSGSIHPRISLTHPLPHPLSSPLSFPGFVRFPVPSFFSPRPPISFMDSVAYFHRLSPLLPSSPSRPVPSTHQFIPFPSQPLQHQRQMTRPAAFRLQREFRTIRKLDQLCSGVGFPGYHGDRPREELINLLLGVDREAVKRRESRIRTLRRRRSDNKRRRSTSPIPSPSVSSAPATDGDGGGTPPPKKRLKIPD